MEKSVCSTVPPSISCVFSTSGTASSWTVFEDFWNSASRSSSDESEREERKPQPKSTSQRIEAAPTALFATGETSTRPAEEEGKAFAGASVLDRIQKTDFSEVPSGDQAVLERFAERLLKQMSRRLSRRLKIAEFGAQIDLRRTIRRNIGRGGEPIDLRYKGKKLQQVQIVILLDVSGSMNLYSIFLLKFAHAIQKAFQAGRHLYFQHNASRCYGRAANAESGRRTRIALENCDVLVRRH